MADLPATERPAGQWRDAIVLVALVALVACPSLFTRDLWSPDEPRYMEVAREMVVLGDYVIPHLNGEVYMQKPPMFFWLAGLLWRAGFGYDSGRLVTLVAVCATLLLTYRLCRPRIGRVPALLAGAAALTCLALLKFASIGVLDPLLMLFVTAAVFAGWRAFHCEVRRAALLLWAACYFAMGLGTLTKGPVGALVPGLILLAYGIADRRNVRAGGVAHAVGFAVFAAVVLAWLIPAIVTGGPDYARNILVRQNLGRAVDSYSHRNPFYYYLLRWPAYFFPWSLILPLAVCSAVRRWREMDSVVRLSVFWLVVPFVFFSCISGKRLNYIVPTMPAAGVLCAWYLSLTPAAKGRLLRSEKWLLGGAFVCVALMTVLLMGTVPAAPAAIQRMYPEAEFGREVALFLTPARMAVALAMLAVPLAISLWGAFHPRESSLRRAAMLVAAVVLVSAGTDLFMLPAANTVKSGKRFGHEVRLRAEGSRRPCLFGGDYSGMYNLYTGYVRMPVLGSRREMLDALADPDTLILGDSDRLDNALTEPEIGRYTIYEERIGHRRMLLLAGKARGEAPSRPASQSDSGPPA
jgi:4-amino-4-deoxy-L-arabinose transferase-like glycosyltransferase